MTLAAALIALAALAGPAQAATRTVTKTFANPSPILIPAGSPATSMGPASLYPSEVEVSGLRRGRILDVNLALKNFSHSYPWDLDLLLVSPTGQNSIVMSDAGGIGPGVNGATLTLDDEASNVLPRLNTPTSGSYQPWDYDPSDNFDFFPQPAPTPNPEWLLNAFDATNPNGAWKLYVYDQSGGDFGQFAGGWALTIKAKVRR